MAQALESQIVKLSKAIPAMIQQSIKKAMQPARDKLRGLCATVEPKAPKSPPDDWWVGYASVLEMVSDEEIYHSRPPPPPMLFVREIDPSWKPGGVDTTSYHDLRTLLDKWVVPGPRKPLELPPNPLMSIAAEITSWHFHTAMYIWGPHPNH
ncbi:hypothetical protein HAX54_026953 [Datura stramonium]|uniref:Uncharacterized protein n=1 Tax=Datura stramonium TaxID=4076 RepID=A0ABS8V1X9_DATST|nr:hypothetical protein [Datura stramonium]